MDRYSFMISSLTLNFTRTHSVFRSKIQIELSEKKMVCVRWKKNVLNTVRQQWQEQESAGWLHTVLALFIKEKLVHSVLYRLRVQMALYWSPMQNYFDVRSRNVKISIFDTDDGLYTCTCVKIMLNRMSWWNELLLIHCECDCTVYDVAYLVNQTTANV